MLGALVAALLAVAAYIAWLLTFEEHNTLALVTGVAFWVFVAAVPLWPLGLYVRRRLRERGR